MNPVVVEYRRYDPIEPAPIAMVVAVDDSGRMFCPITLETWDPGDRWKLGETMSVKNWDEWWKANGDRAEAHTGIRTITPKHGMCGCADGIMCDLHRRQYQQPTCCRKHQDLGYDDGGFCAGAPKK